MGQPHPSTAEERAQYVQQRFAQEGEYGFVTQLSQQIGASRQTVYAWRARGAQALVAAFQPETPGASRVAPCLARQVLTLSVEGHASYRGIQRALQEVTGQWTSLGHIHTVLAQAQQRARQWLATHQPPDRRAVALDELYGQRRAGAYRNIVDVQSGAVWWAEGPLPVDGEPWTLVLWEAQAHGLAWQQIVTDGASGRGQACAQASPALVVQRDLWQVLPRCSQGQGRVERARTTLCQQLAAGERRAARAAGGVATRGPRPGGDLATQRAALVAATRTAVDLQRLTRELQRLLAVVVLDHRGLLTLAQRAADLTALLALRQEVVTAAPPPVRAELQRLHRHIAQALPGLRCFAAHLDQVQQDWQAVLPHAQQTLLAWAWQRRGALGVTSAQLLAWLPAVWRQAAQVLLHAWASAVRVSSAVERWHSLLRPPLAVHRTLSPGLLALLAVWHKHRVFPRGDHQGHNPLHLSGRLETPTDWLAVLDYPAAPPPAPPARPATSRHTSTQALAA